LWVKLAQSGNHSRVSCITYTIGRQELEGPSRRPFCEEGPDSCYCTVRGPSVVACRWMRVISSPNGSMTDARQLNRHC